MLRKSQISRRMLETPPLALLLIASHGSGGLILFEILVKMSSFEASRA